MSELVSVMPQETRAGIRSITVEGNEFHLVVLPRRSPLTSRAKREAGDAETAPMREWLEVNLSPRPVRSGASHEPRGEPDLRGRQPTKRLLWWLINFEDLGEAERFFEAFGPKA